MAVTMGKTTVSESGRVYLELDASEVMAILQAELVVSVSLRTKAGDTLLGEITQAPTPHNVHALDTALGQYVACAD